MRRIITTSLIYLIIVIVQSSFFIQMPKRTLKKEFDLIMTHKKIDDLRLTEFKYIKGLELYDILDPEGKEKLIYGFTDTDKYKELGQYGKNEFTKLRIYYNEPHSDISKILPFIILTNLIFVLSLFFMKIPLNNSEVGEFFEGIFLILNSRSMIIYSNETDISGSINSLKRAFYNLNDTKIEKIKKLNNNQKITFEDLFYNKRKYLLEVKKEKNRFFMYFKDLTKENFLRNEIEKNSELSTLGRFSTMIAHELRNPLGTIKASASTIVEYENDEGNIKLLRYIIEETDRLSKLVDKMLNFSRDVKLNIQDIDLKGFFLNLKTELEKIISKDVELKMNFKNPMLFCRLDEMLLKNMITNIFENAVKAIKRTERKGIIEISIAKTGNDVTFSISNNGEKIEFDKDKIFEPFFSGDTKGFGLGLAIVKKIVELHQGSIKVETNNDITVFIIQLRCQNA